MLLSPPLSLSLIGAGLTDAFLILVVKATLVFDMQGPLCRALPVSIGLYVRVDGG